jgi:hypothetical protein
MESLDDTLRRRPDLAGPFQFDINRQISSSCDNPATVELRQNSTLGFDFEAPVASAEEEVDEMEEENSADNTDEIEDLEDGEDPEEGGDLRNPHLTLLDYKLRQYSTLMGNSQSAHPSPPGALATGRREAA